MKSVTLKLPELLEMGNDELAMVMAARLYELGKVSLGQGADIAGVSKRTFAELLGKYNVSIFNYPPSDLARDVANA